MVFSTCFETIKESSCRTNLQVSVSDPQHTPHTHVFGPGETIVLPDLQFLVHSGRSTIYSFFFLFGQCCFKSQGRLKDDSSIQQHSIFTTGVPGVHWHIT